MEADKETPVALKKSSLDVVRLFALFIVMFIVAWALQYPAFFLAEVAHQGGHAIGGILYRGDLTGFSIDPDVIPWNMAGSVTIANGDLSASRTLAGPLADFFMLPILAAVLIVIVGYVKPKTLGRFLAADFLELIAFWAGFTMYKAALATSQNTAIMDVVYTQNSTFSSLFQILMAVVSVIGIGLMLFYIIKWLAGFIRNVGLVKDNKLWNPYVIAAISLVIAVVLYVLSTDLVLTVAPYVMLVSFGLILFSQAGFGKKAEPVPA
jgi:hypothetical protein